MMWSLLYHGGLEVSEWGKGIPVGSLLYLTWIHLITFGGSLILVDLQSSLDKKKLSI